MQTHSTTLSCRGYAITKEEFDDKTLETFRNELTVTPIVNSEYDFTTKPVSFKLFLESTSKLYLPKYYGIKKFGPPLHIKHKSERIDVKFHGELRPEQIEPANNVLEACLDPNKQGGVLNLFCGGGKTTISLWVVSKIGRKTLVVVHKDFLLQQWKERVQQFLPSARIGLIKAKTIDIENKDIVIASLQSLAMKEYDEKLFKGFGLSIIDEVHHTSAEVFSQALKKINFEYSIGLSATIRRKDGLSKIFMWYLGDVVFRACKREDTVNVLFKEYYDPNPYYSKECFVYGKLNIAKMINNVCEYFPRTEYLTSILQSILEKEPNRKVLILSDRRNHLQTMYDYFRRLGLDCGIYIGGMKQQTLIECENKQIILATFAIASEGYDQKGLDTLILASPKSDVVQSVGRILRDKEHERKHIPMIIDIVDMFSIFERQGLKRLAFYKKNKYNIEKNALYDKSKLELKGVCLIK